MDGTLTLRSAIRHSGVYFTLRKINCLSACGGKMTLFD